MLTILLLSIEVIAGFIWLKTSMEEAHRQLNDRLDALEERLHQQQKP